MDIIEKIAVFSSKLTIQYIHRESDIALDNDRLLDIKNLFYKVYASKGLENGWKDYHKIKIDTGDFPDIIITDIPLTKTALLTFQKIFIENTHQVIISISKFLKKEELENYIELGISYMMLEPIDIAQFNLVIGRASEYIYHKKWEKKRRDEMNVEIEELKKEISKYRKYENNIIALLTNELWDDDNNIVNVDSIEDLKLIDYKDGLTRMGGDEDLYKDLLKGFCDYYQNCVSDIKKAFIDRNMEEIAVLAHSVKGAAGNVSAKTIYDIIVELENTVKSGEDDIKIFISIVKFEKAFNQLCLALHKLI